MGWPVVYRQPTSREAASGPPASISSCINLGKHSHLRGLIWLMLPPIVQIPGAFPRACDVIACQRPRPRVSTFALTGCRAGGTDSAGLAVATASAGMSRLPDASFQTGRLALAADRGTNQRMIAELAPLVVRSNGFVTKI